MSNEDPVDGRCNARTRDGGYCANHPVDNAARCRMHGGTNDGPPEGNGNAETHGMTADAEKWFQRHREDVEDDVKEMVAGWMELAPFGWEVQGHVRMLVNAAINECQIEQGDEYIRDEGVIVTELIPTQEGAISKDEENPAFGAKSRLQRDTIHILNKLGILDSPEAQHADAVGDVSDVWRDELVQGSESE